MREEELNNEETTEGDESPQVFDESDASYVEGQKKKSSAGSLTVLGVVVAVAAVVCFVYFKKGPQSAAAETAEQTTASATINDFLHGNGGSAKLMEQTLHDTQKVVEEFRNTSHKLQVPLEGLHTNPFRLKDAKPQPQVAEAAPSRIQEDEERQRILSEANGLELQSVLRGGNSACLLNTTLYHVGDSVGGFTIEEIRPKSVIVRQGKYRFELAMKR